MIIKRKIMKMLTAKEEEIMGYFWEKGPLFVKQDDFGTVGKMVWTKD